MITAPAAATVQQDQAGIPGLSLSESGITSAESFTVALADTNGLLLAVGIGVTSSGTKNLTVAGTLSRSMPISRH